MAARELPKTLRREEVDALMAMPNLDAPTGLRDRCMLTLMHRAGLRVSEVCKLHLRDIHWRDHELHIRTDVGKGGKEAMLPLDDDTLAWLERWKSVRRRYAAGSPWLFVTLRGGPVDRRCVWEMLDRRARKAGIRHTHPHMLRHTFASDLLRERFSIEEVRRLMRHSDIRTTSIYLHVHDADLAAKVRAR
jgi:integrase/recombinase XerD